jgi:sortase A
MCYGIYKENNIRTEESNNVITENTLETNEINSIISVEIQQIEEKYMGYDVIAKLEVPKINLETYVLKDYTSDGMKVCASKFWGPEPNEVGNFCIAGHNYDQENMFNHLIDLEKGDELYLTDNKNGKYTYIVYDIYKVKPQNTTPIEQETNGKRIVTLITCVNYSKNRLIVQAIEK